MAIRLGIVVPCYNEEEVLPETNRRLLDLLNHLQQSGLVTADSALYFPEFRSTFIHYTKAISISSMVRNIFSCFLVSATRRETLKFFFSSRMYTL